MIRLQWNALRLGHRVLVHDERTHDMRLIPGRVTTIPTTPDSDGVAIRVGPAADPSGVIRPRRLAVHLDPLDLAEECWRCALAADAARQLRDPAPDDLSTE